MISKERVLHIAKLAKLKLTDKEVEMFTKDLSKIFDFIGQLNEVKTGNVEETSQVTGLENILREDEIELCEYEDELLKSTPHKIDNHSVKIPKIM